MIKVPYGWTVPTKSHCECWFLTIYWNQSYCNCFISLLTMGLNLWVHTAKCKFMSFNFERGILLWSSNSVIKLTFTNITNSSFFVELGFAPGWWSIWKHRVPTAPGKPWKPGKMRVTFPVMEISWNFEILKNIMEKWEEIWKNENFSYCQYTFPAFYMLLNNAVGRFYSLELNQ